MANPTSAGYDLSCDTTPKTSTVLPVKVESYGYAAKAIDEIGQKVTTKN